MTINKKQNGPELTLELEGRLDTVTAPELEKVVREELSGVTDLVFDMAQMEYVSSAGLRVLLTAQKRMNEQGNMKLVHVNNTVLEVFEITGFSEILNVE